MPTISEGLLRDLRRISGLALVEDEAGRAARARDLWPQALWWDEGELRRRAPAVVARPSSEREVSELLRWASRQGVPIVPRGNGSGVCGAAAPDSPDAVVLETLRMDSAAPRLEDGAVLADAGVLGGELERRLNAVGRSLMHFPASLEISTVGGWIAAGSSGQMSTLYGGVEEQVLRVRAALGDGSLVDEGVDATFLSEGSLGVVTRAELRIRPLPRRQDFLAARYEELEPALEAARRLCVEGRPPAVLRLYDAVDAAATGVSKDDGSRWLPHEAVLSAQAFALGYPRLLERLMGGGHWWLVCVLEDCDDEAARRAASALRAEGGRLDSAPARRWWGRRYHWDHRKLAGLMARGCFVDTLDLEAGWESLAGLYRAVRAARPEGVMLMGHFAHFEKDGACLYVSAAGRRSGRERTRAVHAETWRGLIEAALGAGAKPTHHHGVGLAKRPWLKACLGPRLRAMREAKARRDPRSILMPGRLA